MISSLCISRNILFAVTTVLILTVVIENVQAQNIGRGHQILLDRGLQIQAQTFPQANGNTIDMARWTESRFTTVNLQWVAKPEVLGSAPGISWGRWLGWTYDLTAQEQPYASSMVSVQVGDEQDLTKSSEVAAVASHLAYWRTHYPHVMGFTNQCGNSISDSAMLNYMSQAKPDMLMRDLYPFYGQEWMSNARGLRTYYYDFVEQYRRLSLKGNDGTGQTPIPHALYLQTFTDPNWTYTVSESELYFQYFSAWTMGCKFLSAFVYHRACCCNVVSVFFTGVGESNPTPLFYSAAEANRQSRNLGPSLVRLLSNGIYIQCGQYLSGGKAVQSPRPSSISAWSSGAIPYLTGVSATNLGTKNSGLPGDVLLGRFKVLSENFDGPNYNNQTYFVVLNGLCAPNSSAQQTRQRVQLVFDFGSSGITSLQRMSRNTGLVETVPLVSLGGSQYKLDLTLDGGTADLFKYNTGAPFVGQPPGVPTNVTATANSPFKIQLYWNAAADGVPVSGYNIYRNGEQVGTSSTISYLDAGLTPSTTYSYTVSAYDSGGNESAQSSPPAAATTMEPDTETPSVPTNIVALANSHVSIALSWAASTDNVEVTGYKVFRNGSQVGISAVTSYLDTDLSPGTIYSYTVSAYDESGNESAQSSPPAIAMTMDSDTEAPGVPTDVVTTVVCPTRVKIDWTASTDNVGVAGYKIFQNSNQVGTATGTTFTDVYGNVLPSTTYSYTVSAYDAAGNDSGQSASSEVTTGAAPTSHLFDMDGSKIVSSTQPYTHTWNQTTTISDAKYHWCIYFKNHAGAGNMQVVTMKGLGASDYTYWPPAQSSPYWQEYCTGANGYAPAPGVHSQLKAYFPYAQSITVDWIRLHHDSWYDRFAPTVMNVTSDLEDGTYGTDQEVDVRITFSEVVNVTGAPRLLLETGDTDHYATYSSGSGSRTLVFLYTVQEEDISDNLDYVGTDSLELNGGTIKDGYGNNAVLTLPEPGAPMSLGNNKNIVIAQGPPDEEAPSIPTDVTAVTQWETSVQITWTASSDNVSVKGYRIFRNGDPVGTSNTTIYVDTGLTAATTFSYTVSAYDAAGNNSEQSSPPAVATTPDNTPPSVPTDVAATSVSGSAIEVTWAASTDNLAVAGYRVFRNGAEVGTTGGSTSYADSGLQNATSYTYTVSAFDAASNESAQSAPATATTFDVQPPSVPTNVQATALSYSSVQVTWTASTDNVVVTGYRIFRDGSEVGTSDTTSFEDRGLEANRTYSYTVSAYDAAGNNSGQSSPAAVTATPRSGEGQRGVTGGVGLNTIGMLVRLWGSFTYVDESTFLINDGEMPIECVVPPDVTLDSNWEYVGVVGISSCYKSGDDLIPLIKVRHAEDITPF